jgi:hypothetical protein
VYAGGDTGRGETGRCDLANADDPQYAPLELQQPAIDQDKPLSPLTKSSLPPGFSPTDLPTLGYPTQAFVFRLVGKVVASISQLDRQGTSNEQRLSQRIKSPLPSPFSPLPGTASFAFFTADCRTDRFFGQYNGEYFNYARPHQGIEQRIPCRQGSRDRSLARGKVVSRPLLGGLHHDYHWKVLESESQLRAA